MTLLLVVVDVIVAVEVVVFGVDSPIKLLIEKRLHLLEFCCAIGGNTSGNVVCGS